MVPELVLQIATFSRKFWSDRRQSAQKLFPLANYSPTPPPTLPEHAHMCSAMYHNHFISPNGVVGRQVSRHRLPTDILRRERKSAERTWLKTLTDVVCFCCLASVRSLLFLSQKLEILARQAI